MTKNFNFRALLAFSHDAVAAGVAWCLAYWLRFSFDIPPAFSAGMWWLIALVVPLYAAIFFGFGLYRGLWRYASLLDIKRIVLAVGLATLALTLILFLLRFDVLVPRSVPVLHLILLLLIMSGSRIAYRLWKENRLYGLLSKEGAPVLILGAGSAAATLVRELDRSKEWRVVGLLDDDQTMHGRSLHGAKVLGALTELGQRARDSAAAHAIIAMPSASHAVRRRALDLCREAGLAVLTVPSFTDLMSGRVTVSQVRRVEVEDLLGRDPVVLDQEGLRNFLSGQVIMVTGAGGSIGSELCRQIAAFRPGRLVLFEQNEFGLYALEQEFHEQHPDILISSVIGDIKNSTRVERIVAQYAPAAIFHAAAYKHVPLMEELNSWQAVCNNVVGTHTVARAAVRHGVKKFVLVSTDKAVNPTNVMGATKRLAEMVCQALQSQSGTRFEVVRFGNVLGSAGSVIPKFRQQIAKGGPVTVTHAEIIRYFMSIPEACQLVLQAGFMGEGGEIFVMDMGEPIKIVDLAREMIRLSGYTEEEIKIVFTGLRPGEKLYEELLADNEKTRPSAHPKLRIATAAETRLINLDDLTRWLEQKRDLTDDEVRRELKKWLPEYKTTLQPALKVV